ncbi:MAG: geranylgeranyl reductase family protein [Dehalococcoidia bacterium]|nr:geranylgeranyl reductase family protein [Dehalococcoidia bacterium]
MTTDRYDAIVVGAGPSGSTAARELAAGGARVLLMDRAKFPRDKPCGGGLTIRASRLMPPGYEGVIEQTVYAARFSYKQKPSFERRSEQALTYMTQRRHLDLFLAESAERAGAVFHDGERTDSIERSGDGVLVRTASSLYRCSLLVGADGANGVVARAVGLTPRYTAWVALEGNASDGESVRQWRDTIGIDVGSVPGGYGWLFAKGEHVNVGVGGWETIAADLRGLLERVSRFYGLSADRLENLKGHALPIRRPGSPVIGDGVMLVGDAAALVDPLSGEGIHSALLSGTLSAEAGLRFLSTGNGLGRYQDGIESDLGKDLLFSRKLQKLFQLTPRLYLSIVKRSPRVWLKLEQLVRGEAGYDTIRRDSKILGPLLEAAGTLIPEMGLRR